MKEFFAFNAFYFFYYGGCIRVGIPLRSDV